MFEVRNANHENDRPGTISTSLACVVTALLLLRPALRPAEPAADEPASPGRRATCAAHGAPKELCFICDASLRDEGRLWCREHGRYEDRCWVCHPELQDKDRLWCKEHSLYEDECFLCHPELLEDIRPPSTRETARFSADVQRARRARAGVRHLPSRVAGPGSAATGPEGAPAIGDSAAKAGVVVGTPDLQPMEDGVELSSPSSRSTRTS